jgi:hypothetical protein
MQRSSDSTVWTALGGHGRGTGDDGPLLIAGRRYPDSFLDRVIEAGCSFAIKPYTHDGDRELARWGDTVVVTATGAERLGIRPPQFHELL